MKNTLFRLSIFLGAFVIAATTALSPLIDSPETQAANASDFKPGRIIDDAIFYNAASMTTSQIQTFLNARVPNCDTNGTGIASEFGSSLTRAQFAASQGWNAPPYTCLKDYRQNTPQMEAASGLCAAISARTNATAAQIIKDVSQACTINPQVLIVLLEKEQRLITDIWPLQVQYRNATGFACPDTAPCDPDFEGFFFQVYYAARQFQVYKAFPNSYNYIANQTNRIYWHPDLTRCGSSNVFIENQATAALYIYTPYRPNQAALNNLYGTGDSCSSYGNRNFWRIFTDWFGSTTASLIDSSGLLLYGWNTGEQITAVFDIKNTSQSTLNVDYVRVRAVNENGTQYLFTAKDDLTLKPGERYKYQQSLTIAEEGTYTFTIDRRVGTTWYSVPFSDFNYTGTTSVVRTIYHAPTITSSLELNRSSFHVNEPVAATFTVNNTSALRSVDLGTLKVEAFDAAGRQYQFGSDTDVLLGTGQTYTYNKSLAFNRAGRYEVEVVNNSTGRGWNTTYPASVTSGVIRKINIDVKNQATLTQGLSLNQSTTREGETLTATFRVRNFGTTPVNVGSLKAEAFDVAGRQYQFTSTDANLTISPGAEYTYSASRPAPTKNLYTFRIVNFNNTAGWNYSLPVSESPSIVRSATVNVKYPIDTTSSLLITPSDLIAGNTATATFSIRNFGTAPINIGTLKVEAFDAAGRQYQFPSTSANLTLAAGETYTYSENTTLNRQGSFNFRIVHKHPQFGWNITLPASADGSIVRSQTVIVR